MKENNLMRGLMLEHISRERRNQVQKKLREKLKKYDEGYSKIQNLLETMQKDKESWATKMTIVETKSRK